MRFCLHHISDTILNVNKSSIGTSTHIKILIANIQSSYSQLASPQYNYAPTKGQSLSTMPQQHIHIKSTQMFHHGAPPLRHICDRAFPLMLGGGECVFTWLETPWHIPLDLQLRSGTSPSPSWLSSLPDHIIFKAVCVFLNVDSMAHSTRPRLVCGWLRSTHWHFHSDTHTQTTLLHISSFDITCYHLLFCHIIQDNGILCHGHCFMQVSSAYVGYFMTD